MFERVLYPVDPALNSGAHHGLELLRPQVEQWGAELVLLSVLPSLAMPLVAEFFPAEARERMLAEAESRLARVAADVLAAEQPITTLVRDGTPYEEILAAAREIQANLIVMPGRSPSTDRRRMLGSNTFKVVTQAPCAVLVLPQQVLTRA